MVGLQGLWEVVRDSFLSSVLGCLAACSDSQEHPGREVVVEMEVCQGRSDLDFLLVYITNLQLMLDIKLSAHVLCAWGGWGYVDIGIFSTVNINISDALRSANRNCNLTGQ